MKSYTLSIQLIFEYCHKDTFEFSKGKKYTYDEFTFTDSSTSLTITIKPNFELILEGIVCEDYNKAVIMAEKILPDICKVLTLIIQIYSAENEEFQPNLSYNIAYLKEISCKEISFNELKDESKHQPMNLLIKEAFILRESVSMTVTRQIPLDIFPALYESKSILFMDVIYRATRCRDVLSKYFTLFTMIEFIESKYTKEIKVGKIVNKSNKSQFKKSFNEIFSKTDNISKERLLSRIMNILCTATVETRAEKLCEIIKNKYKIESISQSLINYDITPEKMEEFIEMRNSIFHGGEIDDKNRNLQIQKTNELLFLCLKITEFEAKNN